MATHFLLLRIKFCLTLALIALYGFAPAIASNTGQLKSVPTTLAPNSHNLHFESLNHFGSNPGELTASYIPGKNNQPLVVLLHGCGQIGQEFAYQSGFGQAAAELGFTLLVPQQHKHNNPQACFNWFSDSDVLNQQGEIGSILNMITTLRDIYSAKHIFIAGLSAGGAMASNLLALHPEVFTAGAVVSGIGYPCANSLVKAISCMKHGPADPVSQLSKSLGQSLQGRDAPNLAVFVGLDDKIVNPINGQKFVNSWVMALGYAAGSANQPQQTMTSEFSHSQWQLKNGSSPIDLFELSAFGHGWSVNGAEKFGGKPAPYLVEHQLSTTGKLLQLWKLI